MATVIAKKNKPEAPSKAPFTMTIMLNGETTTFDTYPSSWILDMERADDYLMTEDEFIERLIAEWSIDTVSGVFDMIFEGDVLKDLLRSASVEVTLK